MSDRRAPNARLPHNRGPPTMTNQVRLQGWPGMGNSIGNSTYVNPSTQPWTALNTADGKHVYYHNRMTNETTWTRPAEYADPGPMMHACAAGPSTTPTQIAVPGTQWFEVTQPGKPSYFHRPDTKEVTWTPPAEVVQARASGGRKVRPAAGGNAAPAMGDGTARHPSTSQHVQKLNAEMKTNAPDANAGTSYEKNAEPTPTDDDATDDDVEFDPDAYEMEENIYEIQPEETVVINGFSVPVSALAPEDLRMLRAQEKGEANDEAKIVEPEKKKMESPAELSARQFTELLTEKGVDSKSRWDRAVRSIQSDKRFKAIKTHAERRRMFEKFVRDANDDEKKQSEKQKNEKQDEKKTFNSDDAERARERKRKEDRLRSERAVADARISRLRKQNVHNKSVEDFEILLAEVVRDPTASWDDLKKKLFADSQNRATVTTDFTETEMRSLFDNHVQRVLHQRVLGVTYLLDERLLAKSGKDFEEGDGEEEDDDDDDDEDKKKNPFTSFVAVSAYTKVASDLRWERCPLEHRASVYCAHIEKLCSKFEVDIPEEVAALRDELRSARDARFGEYNNQDTDAPEEGEE